MSVAQKNVVVLDFASVPVRPKPIDVEKFVTRELKVQCKDLKTVQMQINSGQTLLEFHDPGVAEIVTTKNMRHSIQCGEKTCLIPVYFKQDTVKVKVFDLPPELPSEKIANSLSQYGKVLTIEDDKWKKYFVGLANGVKILHMSLARPIPKRLTINGCIGTILYKGQPREGLNRKKSKDKKTDDSNNNIKNTSNENNNNTSNGKNNNNNTSNEINNKQQQNNNNSSDNNINDQEEPKPDEEGEEEQQPPNNNNHIINNDNNNKNKNSNNNYSINNNEKEKQISDPVQDDEGFEVVRSKHDRKILKRQHSEGKATPAKLPGHLRADFFGRRWIEAYRKSEEAVDVVSKQQAERLKMMFKEKFEECYFKLPKEEQEQVTVFEDIIDLELYND